MTRFIIFPLIAALALAGCIGAVNAPPADPGLDLEAPTAPRALNLSWGFTDCTAAIGLFPVQASKLKPFLPEGFRAHSFPEMGLPPDPRGDANLGLEAFTCKAGVGLNGTYEKAFYGSMFASVEPPAHLKDPAPGTMHFVKWDVLVHDEALRNALASLGVPAKAGSVGSTVAKTPLGDGNLLSLDLTLDGKKFNFQTGGPASPLTGNFVEYTAVPGGLVKWTATFTGVTGNAPGTIAIDPASDAYKIAGSDRVQALFYQSTALTFKDGTITFVPAGTNATAPAK
ncbi:MAG TPA: hypothetical protein VM889_11325 [Candidatus Thermoplasmatota archaeon]|nr:hypothetical protein [Candidatus Thermoplasmatota archaeon]